MTQIIMVEQVFLSDFKHISCSMSQALCDIERETIHFNTLTLYCEDTNVTPTHLGDVPFGAVVLVSLCTGIPPTMTAVQPKVKLVDPII